MKDTKKTRFKVIPAAPLRSRAEAEECLFELREAAIDKAAANAAKQRELAHIDEIYTAEIAECDAVIKRASERLCDWADANPEEFGDKRSLEMTHGTLGWRTGMPQLVKVAKATWAEMVERVRAALGEGFVRTKQEVDREAIIAARGSLDGAALRKAGLAIQQTEGFYVDPKLDPIETRANVERPAA